MGRFAYSLPDGEMARQSQMEKPVKAWIEEATEAGSLLEFNRHYTLSLRLTQPAVSACFANEVCCTEWVASSDTVELEIVKQDREMKVELEHIGQHHVWVARFSLALERGRQCAVCQLRVRPRDPGRALVTFLVYTKRRLRNSKGSRKELFCQFVLELPLTQQEPRPTR
jgi:hypothetical protein